MKPKIQKYNQKMEIMKERQERGHLQEILTIEEESKGRELKNRKLLQSRTNHEKMLEESKIKLLIKIEKYDERIRNQRLVQEHEKQKKFNKLYMIREVRKDQVIRNGKTQSFKRKFKMEQINLRMEKIEEMQKERHLLDEERRKMEEEINKKKCYVR